MDKIAAEAAQRIAQDFHDQVREHYEPDVVFMAKIIESALSQSLAARDKEIEELAKKWDLWADTHLDGEALTVANKCHFDLSALLKGKAI